MIRTYLIVVLFVGVITGILGFLLGIRNADILGTVLSFIYLVVSAYCLQLVIRSK
jgi:hypothetical protein